MVGRRLVIWDKESVLWHLHPSTRGGVVGVHLEKWCRHSELHLRLHRILQPVDVGDGGRDAEGDGLGALRGVFGGVDGGVELQELNPVRRTFPNVEEALCDAFQDWFCFIGDYIPINVRDALRDKSVVKRVYSLNDRETVETRSLRRSTSDVEDSCVWYASRTFFCSALSAL